MSNKPENPPAFPSHAGDPEMTDPRNRISCGGMTLRDYFAGRALTGGLAATDNWNFCTPEQCARQAYQIADAMLRERGK